jgi:hypothetical protein
MALGRNLMRLAELRVFTGYGTPRVRTPGPHKYFDVACVPNVAVDAGLRGERFVFGTASDDAAAIGPAPTIPAQCDVPFAALEAVTQKEEAHLRDSCRPGKPPEEQLRVEGLRVHDWRLCEHCLIDAYPLASTPFP